jgi:hypothetical protein
MQPASAKRRQLTKASTVFTQNGLLVEYWQALQELMRWLRRALPYRNERTTSVMRCLFWNQLLIGDFWG